MAEEYPLALHTLEKGKSKSTGHTEQIPVLFFFPPPHLPVFSISLHPSLTFNHFLSLLSFSMRQKNTWLEESEKAE